MQGWIISALRLTELVLILMLMLISVLMLIMNNNIAGDDHHQCCWIDWAMLILILRKKMYNCTCDQSCSIDCADADSGADADKEQQCCRGGRCIDQCC